MYPQRQLNTVPDRTPRAYHVAVEARVLVVEDDDRIAVAVADSLTADGYLTRRAGSILEGQLLAGEWDPALVLLDLGLPDGDGLMLCRQLRATRQHVRIVILTARDDDIDVIAGLDAGANDYVTKPFALPVLRARVRAQLRPAPADGTVAEIGELRVDVAAHRATWRERPLDLRPRELALLVLLMRDHGRVVTHERVLFELWGPEWDQASRKSLDTHLHSLRRKLAADGGPGDWITTIRSIGYRFDAP